jgi:hypothetical protein
MDDVADVSDVYNSVFALKVCRLFSYFVCVVFCFEMKNGKGDGVDTGASCGSLTTVGREYCADGPSRAQERIQISSATYTFELSPLQVFAR